jgi:hypothetical protein
MTQNNAFVLFVIMLAACQDDDAQSSHVTVRDSAGIQIVENATDLWNTPFRWRASAEPIVRIGAVEGEEDYLFDGVRGLVVLSDGRVVVANSGDQSLRWYSQDGVFLVQRGGPGEGPGEFSRLGEISLLDGDTVVAVDWSGRRFTLFGPGGAIGPTTRIDGLTAPPGRMYRLSSGEWILGTSGSSTAQLGEGRPEAGVYRLDSPVLRISADATRVDTLDLFPSSEVEVRTDQGRVIFGPARFGRQLAYAVVNDEVLIGTGDRLQLDFYSPSGTAVRSVRAPDVHVSLTPEVAAAYRAFLRERAVNAPADQRAALERTISDMQLPETMPAFSSIVVDADGNVWVGEYRYDLDPAQQFLVFDTEGRFTGRATVPRSLRVMAIHDGRVWGRTTDELGVEYVVAYELEQQ